MEGVLYVYAGKLDRWEGQDNMVRSRRGWFGLIGMMGLHSRKGGEWKEGCFRERGLKGKKSVGFLMF